MTTGLVSFSIVAYVILLLWIATGWPAGGVFRRPAYLYLHRVVAIAAMLLFGPVGLIFAWGAFGSLTMVLKALWTGVLKRPDFREATGDVVILLSERPGDFWIQVRFYTVIALVLGSIALAIILPFAIYLGQALRKPPR